MKNAGRRGSGQRLAYGAKDPNLKPGKSQGIDWDALKRRNEERLDREWDAGLRNPDTIRRRWMKTLTPAEIKAEYALLDKGQRTPLALGPDGEPRVMGHQPVKAGSVKGRAQPSGNTRAAHRPRNTLKYDVDEIVRLYVEEKMSPVEIRDKLQGPAYETIVIYLKKRQVFEPNRHRTGGSRTRESYDEQRQKYCGVCNTDLDVPGNSNPRTKKMPDGTERPNGRECIPCRRRRSQENYHARKTG